MRLGHVPYRKLIEWITPWKTKLPDAYGFQHASVTQLFQDDAEFEFVRCFVIVRFNATNERRLTSCHRIDQVGKTFGELRRDSGRSGFHSDESARFEMETAMRFVDFTNVAEHIRENVVSARREEIDDVTSQQVAILVQESANLKIREDKRQGLLAGDTLGELTSYSTSPA